jgi:hypothetical protein
LVSRSWKEFAYAGVTAKAERSAKEKRKPDVADLRLGMSVLLGGALEAQSAPNEAFGLKNVQAVALQQAKPMPQDRIADLEIYLLFSVYC